MKIWTLRVALIFGLLGCGTSLTAPGAGASFSELDPPMTAADFFSLITGTRVYVPKSLRGTTTGVVSGEAECAGGGSARVEGSVTGNTENYSITYSDCGYFDPESGRPALVADGTVTGQNILNAEMDDATSASLQKHVSFSGDIGFAEDCDYSFAITDTITFSGSCSYRDSEGVELTISGEEMTQVFYSSFSD